MKRIKLENFRCYKDLEIEFKSGINLFVGDNASGKTSIVKACRYVLSSFFTGFKDENTPRLSIHNDNFRQVVDNGVIQPEREIKISFDYRDIVRCEQIDKLRDESKFPFHIKKASRNNSTSIKGLGLYKKYTISIFNDFYGIKDGDRQLPIPLYAAFSTEDIHSSRKINAKVFKSYNQKNSFGYYECLDGDGFFKYWISRLIVLKEGEKNIEEIEIVKKAIVDALGIGGCNIIRDVAIRPNQGKVYFLFTDNREIEAFMLSDGYKRIVNIVMDIAFRCALLNRDLFGLESAVATCGTVLIDEIDLHLHPTLQSTILKGLRNAFPKLQFIVTTHAPMIMSSVESNDENVVYKLNYSFVDEYIVNEVVTYGMDLSTISKVVLDQTPRDQDVANDIKDLFVLIRNNEESKARVMLAELRKKHEVDLPDFVEAEAMLDFRFEDDETDN